MTQLQATYFIANQAVKSNLVIIVLFIYSNAYLFTVTEVAEVTSLVATKSLINR